jgi:hypothetical protein
VFLIALLIPAAALAGNNGKCNASACKVYIEPNGPSAGRGQTPPSQQVGSGKTVHHSTKLSRVLALAGKDRGPLKDLLAGSDVGSLKGGTVGSAGSPSMLGAAFDLGAGPLALLAILLTTAVGLAAAL